MPVYAVRVLATAREALRLAGVADPAQHVAVIRSAWNLRVLVSREPFDEARVHGLALAEIRCLTLVHPYDDAAVIAGQGTIALEMLAQVPQLDTLLAEAE